MDIDGRMGAAEGGYIMVLGLLRGPLEYDYLLKL